MTAHIATDRRANLLGSLWMLLAMALFAIEDSLLKAAATHLPVGQVMIGFGLGGTFVFAALAKATSQPLFPAAVTSRPMLIRVVFEIFGRLFYLLAIAAIPLSAATVILQATPLVVVAAAAILFKEQVGWRRWLAIIIGMVGVLIIVQPGRDSFSALSLLAILGMLGFAGRDLASRAAPASLGTVILGLYGFAAIIVAGVLVSFWQGTGVQRPETGSVLFLTAAVLTGVCAYTSLMRAMRTGQVSAVTPFRYSRLLFGLALGVLAFGETLTPTMLLGSALIVLSGLFILWRGQKSDPPS